MTEFKHTPGPWIWGENFRGLYGAGPNNEVLAYYSYEGMHLSGVPDQKANALLIAAAPELLKALVDLLRAVLPVTVDPYSVERAREAIRKATEPTP